MRYTTLSYDMSQVNQILSQIKSEVDLPAVNATRVDDETAGRRSPIRMRRPDRRWISPG